MQVNRQAQLPEGLEPDQATSANARFHHKPVHRANCTEVVGKGNNACALPEKSLDRFSVSNGAEGKNATSTVISHDALSGATANQRASANDFPLSLADPPSGQSLQSYCDQRGSVGYSQRQAPFRSSTDDSVQWYGGARPKQTQDDYFKNPGKVAADPYNRIVHTSCMTEPFTGYDASPLPPDQSVSSGRLPSYGRVDPPACHVTAGSEYRGLPLAPADSRTQPPCNPPEYAVSTHQQWAAAISNRSTGVAGGFLTAHSGNGSVSDSHSKKSGEVAKTTGIGITRPAMPGQRVDEPALGQSQKSPDVPLSSTAPCCTANAESDRRRKKQEGEMAELEYAGLRPAKQESLAYRFPPGCKHYQRNCWVKFECCNVFYPCHRCHNDKKECSNLEAKASDATHYNCNFCDHEAVIDKNSQHCSHCEARMSVYFCALCKHFTSDDKKPYHCEKCGICRTYRDELYHCDVCNVCLDKKLEGKHKCRPDSRHEPCCICLEDTFSGCHILPCSHKIHEDCAKEMLKNGIRTCPMCRHPLVPVAPKHSPPYRTRRR